MKHSRTPSAAAIAASLVLATLASNPCAQTPGDTHAAVNREVHSLKAAYLRCERAATDRLLDMGEAAACSAIHEELLKVGFDGDFKRLLAWWQAERVATPCGERIATP